LVKPVACGDVLADHPGGRVAERLSGGRRGLVGVDLGVGGRNTEATAARRCGVADAVKASPYRAGENQRTSVAL